MDRALLVRRGLPVAVFVAVLGGLVVAGQRHGSSPSPHPLPINARGGAQDGKAAGAHDSLPAIAPYGGKLVISDDVMSGLPTKGPAYLVGSNAGTDRIKALAAALGVAGEVRTDDDGWVVGTGDRVLRVSDTYGASWYLGPDKGVISGGGSTGVATARPGTITPDAPVTATPNGDTPAEPPAPCPSPSPDTKVVCGTPDETSPPPPPPMPTDAQARTAAAPVLAAVGLSGAPVTVNDGWGTKEVTASPVVGGLPTYGFETRVSVDVHGTVTYANGFLGTTELEADYPLLDRRAAAERGWGGGIEPMLGAPITPCPSGEVCPTAPPDRVVTKIRLGLIFLPSYGATDAYLAPAWLLTVEGATYETPLLALPDAYLATPPPATRDGGSSGGSGGAVAPGTPGTPETKPSAP